MLLQCQNVEMYFRH